MSFRLGRVLGFTLRVDFSWFIVFFLVLWTFAIGVFPVELPGRTDLTYIGMAAITTLLFFASLLLHELSHSLVARSKGIPVEGITLFIFGGIAHMRREASDPGAEFLIAAAGPLASAALAAVLGGAMFVTQSLGLEPAVAMVLRQTALLNVAVAVFNLLPGFPLDGGRLFRALLWRITGKVERATRIAALGGEVLGYALVVLGAWRAFTAHPMSGLWMVFVGWFLRNAAVSSYREHVLAGLLGDARAGQIMTREPVTISPDLSLEAAFNQHFLQRRFAAFPVARNGKPLGVITLQQIRDVAVDDRPQRTVGETMAQVSRDWTVQSTDSLTRVLDGLRNSPARRVLVLDEGRLAGIITSGDVTAWLERTRVVEPE
jgi:Zn-dependent protease/predicted transcriptional regulator